MTESAGDASPEAQRLEELEKATHEYAEYSSQSFGLAGLVAVVLFVVNIAAWVGHPPWVSVLRVLGVLAWLGVLAFARRRYQPAGVVTSRPQKSGFRRFYLVIVYFGTAGATFELAYWFRRQVDVGAYGVACILAMVAVPGLFTAATRVLRGFTDSAITAMLLVFPAGKLESLALPTSPGPDEVGLRVVRVGAVVAVASLVALLLTTLAVASVRQHLAWRRLVRRLALAKEKFP